MEVQTRCMATALPSQAPVDESYVVPRHEIDAVADLIDGAKKLVVITGAGVSTASGIPDYRSPGRPEYKPMTHQQFMNDEYTRRRYWARSFVGYRRLVAANPGPAHEVLAALEKSGKVHHVITQNVDGLHMRAGSSRVLELHGSIHGVECTNCGHQITRPHLQERLRWLNSTTWDAAHSTPTTDASTGDRLYRPDGDVELQEAAYARFTPADCDKCGGLLKPAVTFFGGSIEPSVVQQSLRLIDECDAVLTVGTTLTVFSVFRLTRAAFEAGKPIGVVNFGPTRLDDKRQQGAGSVRADFHVQGDCGTVLANACRHVHGVSLPPALTSMMFS